MHIRVCVGEREKEMCMRVFVRTQEREREKQNYCHRALCMCMYVYVCVSVYVRSRWMDMSLSLYDRTTWALAVCMYVSALGRPSLYTLAHLYVCARASPLSLSLSVCVTDWVGGRTPALAATTLAPRGPSMW
jgi:hypothetical protein